MRLGFPSAFAIYYGDVMVEITSKDNLLIKKILKLNSNAKQRKKLGMFVVEGLRISLDAMLSNCQIDALLLTEKAISKYSEKLEELIEYSSVTYLVKESIFKSISETQTPQGVLCVIKTLDKKSLFDTIKDNGKFLALDGIQDPSNLGTILRTAEAVGISGVILSKDCCDIYSPKVVRGSMGAIFRLPYLTVDTIGDFLLEYKNIKSFASVVDCNAEKVGNINFPKPCVVVVGNEGNGVKQETIDACNQKFTIPMLGRAESLNASVAASIIMWEMMK